MYKMNFDRAVLALWDEKLKEDLHESYYDCIPEMKKFIINPKRMLQTAMTLQKDRRSTMFEILSRWILELEEPDQFELNAFVIRYHELLTDRIHRILDKEEIIVQIKRRRLLG